MNRAVNRGVVQRDQQAAGQHSVHAGHSQTAARPSATVNAGESQATNTHTYIGYCAVQLALLTKAQAQHCHNHPVGSLCATSACHERPWSGHLCSCCTVSLTLLHIPAVYAAVAAPADDAVALWVPGQRQHVALHARQGADILRTRHTRMHLVQLDAAISTRCCQLGHVPTAAAHICAQIAAGCCSQAPDGTAERVCAGYWAQLPAGQLQQCALQCCCKQAPVRVAWCSCPCNAADFTAVCTRDALQQAGDV